MNVAVFEAKSELSTSLDRACRGEEVALPLATQDGAFAAAATKVGLKAV